MHDLEYFRQNLEKYEEMARQRGIDLNLNDFAALDRDRRQLITSVERLKADRNKASDQIARLKKAGQDASSVIAEMKAVSDRIREDDLRIAEFDTRLRDFLLVIPNLPHASVPPGQGAGQNAEIRRWGQPPEFKFTPRPHWEVGERAGILDLPRAAKIAGARFAVY